MRKDHSNFKGFNFMGCRPVTCVEKPRSELGFKNSPRRNQVTVLNLKRDEIELYPKPILEILKTRPVKIRTSEDDTLLRGQESGAINCFIYLKRKCAYCLKR